ncbi:polyprenyl synthetase family protein [Robiginitalea aurantiaca]|uniref:Polyprenyl synthetase family protein n=1 Tax=Robiginitalea aurantiaca TaxID=3056915 RepID=A0ABT7WB63_9FLAO|nr:polyprenyl synthetase family protein [Robiginitalea aurantiaca]MDM9630069.1 polyprenyl synthetase family protein [Robiginitalea aurantiaca]
MTDSITAYRQTFLAHLSQVDLPETPKDLYSPIQYILDIGGKRIRPVLVLLSADLYGAGVEEALPAATAVEIFHNFTLIHDDIMDAAPLRRGKMTVHEKWDTNTAILSGDAMLIEAYRQLEAYPPEEFKPMMNFFSKTALEVCEGQRFDMDYETLDQVGIDQYLKMIEFKTAVLLGCALRMGALVGGASPADQEAMYMFGIQLGLAFQLQDDYLDVYGDPETFGKQVGGDIIENKKTFLYLKALELASDEEARELRDLYSIKTRDPQAKVQRVTQIFKSSGSADAARDMIRMYTNEAFQQLESLKLPEDRISILKEFGEWLLNRNF